MCGLVTTSLDTARNNTLEGICIGWRAYYECYAVAEHNRTYLHTLTATHFTTHVSPGYLATKHWVTFLRRDTELAAVEGRFQVYHTKLPTPSPMFVLDTFLPGIGASLVKPHVTRYGACPTIMNGRPLFVLLTSLSSNCEVQRTNSENCSKM